jgi:hypothetical protein
MIRGLLFSMSFHATAAFILVWQETPVPHVMRGRVEVSPALIV